MTFLYPTKQFIIMLLYAGKMQPLRFKSLYRTSSNHHRSRGQMQHNALRRLAVGSNIGLYIPA